MKLDGNHHHYKQTRVRVGGKNLRNCWTCKYESSGSAMSRSCYFWGAEKHHPARIWAIAHCPRDVNNLVQMPPLQTPDCPTWERKKSDA